VALSNVVAAKIQLFIVPHPFESSQTSLLNARAREALM
jgi:hypothetical protein